MQPDQQQERNPENEMLPFTFDDGSTLEGKATFHSTSLLALYKQKIANLILSKR